jgi:hypothetical protein
MGMKHKIEMNKFTSQKNLKFTSIAMKKGLSSTIFATNGMYMDITYLLDSTC